MTREIKAAAGGSVLAIGKRGENETVRVIFPMLAEADEVVILHRRYGDEHPYAVETSITDNGVVWLVSLADVAIPGTGAAEVIYKNGGKVAKSVTYTTRTAESIDDGETEVPTAAESWVQRVVDLTAEAQSAAGSAETSAGNAADSAESAESAAASAAGSAETARGYTVGIEEAVSRAESARDAAEESASDADASAIQAALNATSAQAAKSQAVSAAQNAAVSADSSATSATSTQESATKAELFALSASESASAAEDFAGRAQTSAQEAQTAAEKARVDIEAETAARTIADAALKRSLDMLWRLNEGISYVFEQDSTEAYSKAVPSGAVVVDIKSIGGHSEVIDGEIISADVKNIEVGGKNLWSKESAYKGTGILYKGSYALVAGTYTMSVKANSIPASIPFFVDYGDGNLIAKARFTSSVINQTFAIERDVEYVEFYSNGYSNIYDVQIERGSSATTYAPYRSATGIPIPPAIRALPGYGWSGNTVDFAAKKYIQTVAAQSIGEDGRLVQELYPVPVETDISALLDDSFESIEVEGGGTVEFKQGGDYRLPVPNREEYLISVAEVSR